MKISDLKKGSYSVEELCYLLDIHSEYDALQVIFYAIEDKLMTSFLIVKLPFELHNTNETFQFECVSDLPNDVISLIDGKSIRILPEYIQVKFKIL